jgi:hypothetical protein
MIPRPKARMNAIFAPKRTLRRQRRQARHLSRYLVGGLSGVISIATLVGVLVVGNNEGARRALLETIGVTEVARGESGFAAATTTALATAPVRAP